jgi:hypothetical protein
MEILSELLENLSELLVLVACLVWGRSGPEGQPGSEIATSLKL